MELTYTQAWKLYEALGGSMNFPKSKEGQKEIIKVFYERLKTPKGRMDVDSPDDTQRDARIYRVAKRLYEALAEKAMSMIKSLTPNELDALKTATSMADYFKEAMNSKKSLGYKEKYVPQMESAIERLAIMSEPIYGKKSPINDIVNETINYMARKIRDFEKMKGLHPCVYPAGVPF